MVQARPINPEKPAAEAAAVPVIAIVVHNLKDRETFFRVWRAGQSLRYTSPPNATITFLFQPNETPK